MSDVWSAADVDALAFYESRDPARVARERIRGSVRSLRAEGRRVLPVAEVLPVVEVVPDVVLKAVRDAHVGRDVAELEAAKSERARADLHVKHMRLLQLVRRSA